MIDPDNERKIVELVEPQPEWSQRFIDAANEIQSILKDNCIHIHHIGSTSIPGMYAKPIVDMLPVVKDIHLVELHNPEFKALGYISLGEYGIPGRRYYWKSKSNRTHNVHIFEQDSPEIARHLAFKNFMITHKDYAEAYSLIKRNLADLFPYDLDHYTDGKSSFIQMIDYKTDTTTPAQLNAEDKIIIEPYDAAWPKLAEAEIKSILEMTRHIPCVAIEHIGSTAVPDLSSKPIIDIFISLNSIAEARHWIKPLETLGYVFWDENPNKSHLRFFKGIPPYGMRRTHHVHIVEASNNTMERRIIFREILRTDTNIRLAYESLKLNLSQSNPSDREAYTDKKGEFIERVLREHGYFKSISKK